MELTRRKKICGALWIAVWAYGFSLLLGLGKLGIGAAFLSLTPALGPGRLEGTGPVMIMMMVVQLFLSAVILVSLLRAFALWSSWFGSVRPTDPEWEQSEFESPESDEVPAGSLECPKCNMIIRPSQNPCPYCGSQRDDT